MTDAQPTLQPLIISAPFGNYIQPAGTTPTLGTFTAMRRPGRAWQVLTTVRYYRRLGAWVNRLGLRNPGIDWLAARAQASKVDTFDKIVSIHGFDAEQWQRLLDRVVSLKPLAVELNMSCPNVGEVDWPQDLFARAVGHGLPVIVKLPPVRYELMADQAAGAGVTRFHCCNTLPVPAGGLSGRPLKPIALQCIRRLREKPYGDTLTLIGGGGIYEPADIDEYRDAGARHFAIATKVFHPKYLFSHHALQPLIGRASQRDG